MTMMRTAPHTKGERHASATAADQDVGALHGPCWAPPPVARSATISLADPAVELRSTGAASSAPTIEAAVPGAETAARTVGVLTIGQSPRADGLSQDMQAVLGPRVRVVERGALDGLTAAEVGQLAPRADDYRLITLLRDGSSVQVSKRAILERLQVQIGALEEDEGVDATLMLCTGEFPAFSHRRPLLLPQAALYGATVGIASGGRIGSLAPLAAQVEQARRKWREMGVADAEVVVANPYGDDPAGAITAASTAARAAGAQVLFMDCFGYNLTMKAAARHAFGGPVVLARSLAARLLVEMID